MDENGNKCVNKCFANQPIRGLPLMGLILKNKFISSYLQFPKLHKQFIVIYKLNLQLYQCRSVLISVLLSDSNFNSNFIIQIVAFRLPQTIGKSFAQTYLFVLAFLSVVLVVQPGTQQNTTISHSKILFQTNSF